MSQKKNVKNTHFGRGRYNSDYAPDAKGVYHYIGSMYHIELEGRKRRKMIFLLTALGLIAAVAFVLGGFSKGRTAQTFYALLPFVCGLLPTGYFLMGLVEWALHKGDFTRKGMDAHGSQCVGIDGVRRDGCHRQHHCVYCPSNDCRRGFVPAGCAAPAGGGDRPNRAAAEGKSHRDPPGR